MEANGKQLSALSDNERCQVTMLVPDTFANMIGRTSQMATAQLVNEPVIALS